MVNIFSFKKAATFLEWLGRDSGDGGDCHVLCETRPRQVQEACHEMMVTYSHVCGLRQAQEAFCLCLAFLCLGDRGCNVIRIWIVSLSVRLCQGSSVIGMHNGPPPLHRSYSIGITAVGAIQGVDEHVVCSAMVVHYLMSWCLQGTLASCAMDRGYRFGVQRHLPGTDAATPEVTSAPVSHTQQASLAFMHAIGSPSSGQLPKPGKILSPLMEHHSTVTSWQMTVHEGHDPGCLMVRAPSVC